MAEEVSVRINGDEKKLNQVDAGWINQQINRRRAEGQSVCVRVTVHTDRLNLVLSTPSCPSGGGGGRPPNCDEEEVFALWERRGLNRRDFHGGNLEAFLKQLAAMI